MALWKEMFRDPYALQYGLTAFADASQDPYRNPILEFALASRQGLNLSRELAEERRQQEEEERRRRDAEDRQRRADERQQAALRLQLSQLWKDDSMRPAIRAAYGDEVVAPLEKLSYGYDEAANELEWQRVGQETAAEKAAQARLQALLTAAAAPAGDVAAQVAALAAAGDMTGAANLIEARAKETLKPRTPQRRGGFSERGIRYEYGPDGKPRRVTDVDYEAQAAAEEREKEIRREEQVLLKLHTSGLGKYRDPPSREEIRRQAEEAVDARLGGGGGRENQGLLGQVIAAAAEQGEVLTREAIEAKARQQGVPFDQVLQVLALALGVLAPGEIP